MDTLVARYSRPAAFQSETHIADNDDDLHNDTTPSLSLKFAMPPVAQVHTARPAGPRAGLAADPLTFRCI